MDDIAKRAVKKTILTLRNLLEKEDIPAVLKQHGIFPDGRRVPAEKIVLLNDSGRSRRERLEAILDREIRSAGNDPHAGVERYCREVAFTFLNRLIALRCMETRGLIDECIKTRADYAGRSLRHNRFRRENPDAHFDAEDTDGLKAFLRSVFRELQDDIKILFDPGDEYSIIMPSLKGLRECIHALNEDIPEDAFREPELIGWVYQYFQTEEKDRVFEDVRTKKKKIQGDDIVPATSLYTERYMVDYLVQNSLGAIWMEMYSDSKLCEKWPYFVKDQDLRPREPRPVKNLTFLDPACGSGHFLLIAFDLLVQMYEEEASLADKGRIPKKWIIPGEKIAATIIESNLHGIDIDLRSVQLSWLVLYLKMREHQNSVDSPKTLPEKVNLVAADASLLDNPEFLSWCEERFKEESHEGVRPTINIIKGVAGRLRNLPEIGSLARPEEDLKELIRKEKERLLNAWKKDKKQLVIFPGLLPPEQQELSFEKVTDEQFWDGVLKYVIKALDEYYRQASEQGDTRAQVMAHEAAKGFGFLELCNKRYDVVGTNPPYMGSKNMGKELKKYVQSVYPEGKRDLYAAFIERSREWVKERGVVSMVTQQSWMFLRSFVKMREKILRENCIQTLAHLGEHAFDDPSAAGAFVVLFTLDNEKPTARHRLVAFRLIALQTPSTKSSMLSDYRLCQEPNIRFYPYQESVREVFESPLVYWLRPKFFEILKHSNKLSQKYYTPKGLTTADNNRFLRFFWEIEPCSSVWKPYVKGGAYRKWYGLQWYIVNWSNNGKSIRDFPSSVVRNERFYFRKGLTYTEVCRGAMGCRVLPDTCMFDARSPGIFSKDRCSNDYVCMALLNTRPVSYLLRALNPLLLFDQAYLGLTPLPDLDMQDKILLSRLASSCTELKASLVSEETTEKDFTRTHTRSIITKSLITRNNVKTSEIENILALLNTIEGLLEKTTFRLYDIHDEDLQTVLNDLGTPVGWYPTIANYNSLPETDICETPREVFEYVSNHQHIDLSQEELSRIKCSLRVLYEAGPRSRAKDMSGREETETGNDGDRSDTYVGKRIPIPTETFLEELSNKMEIHPISIYWLIKEMREKESVICWPQCKRHTEDYLTVMILRMLGFRWPKQVEEGEPVPDWADRDGIIPITDHTGEKTLLERIRDRIGAEFSEGRIGAIEQEFSDILYNAECKEAEVKGRRPPRKKMSLSEWLEREFFKRHTSQFKKRPIAWHLTSSNGTFQVLLFYHKLSRDILRNLKNRYLARVQSYYGVLLERARSGESVSGGLTFGRLQDREAELEDIAAKLDKVMNLPYEPLIDDGVRVNIAPLQKVGVLKHPVLPGKDVDRAIADRNRWREDDKEQNTVWRI